MSKYKFTFIDLFAGIGGFHQAMTYYGGECVFASEIDEECKRTYENQFGMPVHGDINNYIDQIPDFDVLCGGFPCQTFSKAGNREGFDDEIKGQLFFRIIDILKRHPECKFIILENVRNLADHDSFWGVIQRELKQLDFFITEEPLIVSPDNFGIPQNRERVYILGVKKSLRDTSKLTNGWIHESDLHLEQYKEKCPVGRAFSVIEYGTGFPEKVIDDHEKAVLDAWEEFKRDILPDRQIGAPIWLDYFGLGIGDDEEFKERFHYYKQKRRATRTEKTNPELRFLIDSQGYICEDTPDWKRDFIRKNRNLYNSKRSQIDAWYERNGAVLDKKVYRKFEWNCGPCYTDFKECIIQFRQSGIRVKRADFFPSLVAIVNTPIIWDKTLNKYRRLTITESAKLQSFRKGFKFVSPERVVLKQLGNSVNVKVIKIIARQVFELAVPDWDK